MSDMLGRELARCREWIEAALEYSGGTHAFEDIVQGCYEGRMQLWPGIKSAGVTEITAFPRKKVLHVFLAGGDMDELLVMMRSAMAWGRAVGCDGMTMAGRPGWRRVLERHGWSHTFTVMEVGLNPVPVGIPPDGGLGGQSRQLGGGEAPKPA